MGSTDRSTWKKFEMKVSKFFSSSRNPLSGSNSKITASDSIHPKLFIECKLRNDNDSFVTLWNKIKSGRICYCKHKEDLFFLMEHKTFLEFCSSYKENLKALDKLKFLSIYKPSKENFKALLTLYSKTARLAELERKTPVIARHVKHQKGWALFFTERNLKTLFKFVNNG